MSDIQLHMRINEDEKEHVIDCPPDIKGVDFLAELIDGFQLPQANWVLDDEETGVTLDLQASLSNNHVANGHHLRLHKNGVELERAPRKGHLPELPPTKNAETLEPPPSKDEDDERQEEIPAPPEKETKHKGVEWQWVLGSLGALLLVGAVVAGTYWVTHRVGITLTPAETEVAAGNSTKFTAEVKRSSNQAIRWTLNPAQGSIRDDGTYTAPLVVEPGETVVVTATSAADPSKSASARIKLHPVLHVLVNPGETTAFASQSIQFSARVAGTSNERVRWSIAPELGTISPEGLYSAPGTIATPGAVTVTARSEADAGVSASATVILRPPAPVVVSSVQVTPTQANLSNNGQMIFRARVIGTTNQRVVWSASIGSITQGGAYTAPAIIEPGQRAVITAKSVADPSKVARAAIDLHPDVSVRITPAQVTLGAGHRQQQFASYISGTSNGGVRWTASGGTISQFGLFTAPQSKVPLTIKITAASDADPTKQAIAWVTVEPTSAKPEVVNVPEQEATGLILWSGMLEPGQTVTIQGSQVSSGSLLRGALPGVPIVLNVTPLELVGVQEAPSPTNGWKRLVLRSKKRIHAVISIEWKAIR